MANFYSSVKNITRINVLGAFIAFSFLILLYKLFTLQVSDFLIYDSRADAVTRRSEVLPPQRGFIYDRQEEAPLVINESVFSLFVNPSEMIYMTPQQVLSEIADALGLERGTFLSKFTESGEKFSQPIEIMRGLSYDQLISIAEISYRLEGVSWESKPNRVYNFEGSLFHPIGYVGRITSGELHNLLNKGRYNSRSIIGKSGIEKQYDYRLRGEEGVLERIYDAKGRDTERVGNIKYPNNGENVYLTIDKEIQTLSEKALGERRGAVIVLKPGTGEILAMVSSPWFNYNQFNSPEGENFQSYINNPDKPFLNRTIQGAYPPASVFKIIMTAALLEEKAISPYKTITCNGSMTLGNRTFKCHYLPGHGPLNLAQALAESCNIYYGTTGVELLGVEKITAYARAFGLGQMTQIEIQGEIPGVVPSPKFKKDVFNIPWTPGDTLNLSIGQGFLEVTPLQLANVVAAIVNDGTIYKPTLVRKIADSSSNGFPEGVEPEVLTINNISKQTYSTLRADMRGVATVGSARYAILNDVVDVAGKTGTGETGVKGVHHYWFASYGPYGVVDPDEQVVVVVLTEATDSREWWSPKAADIIFQGIFGNQSYEEVIREFQRRHVWYAMDIRLEEESIESET